MVTSAEFERQLARLDDQYRVNVTEDVAVELNCEIGECVSIALGGFPLGVDMSLMPDDALRLARALTVAAQKGRALLSAHGNGGEPG